MGKVNLMSEETRIIGSQSRALHETAQKPDDFKWHIAADALPVFQRCVSFTALLPLISYLYQPHYMEIPPDMVGAFNGVGVFIDTSLHGYMAELRSVDNNYIDTLDFAISE